MSYTLLQISFYLCNISIYRYATEITDVRSSKLFVVQLFFTLFVPVLAIIRFLLQAFVFKGGHIYGYMVRYVYCSLFRQKRFCFPVCLQITLLIFFNPFLCLRHNIFFVHGTSIIFYR